MMVSIEETYAACESLGEIHAVSRMNLNPWGCQILIWNILWKIRQEVKDLERDHESLPKKYITTIDSVASTVKGTPRCQIVNMGFLNQPNPLTR